VKILSNAFPYFAHLRRWALLLLFSLLSTNLKLTGIFKIAIAFPSFMSFKFSPTRSRFRGGD